MTLPDPARPMRPGGPTLEQYDIRIAHDGTWYHEGQPIRRLELVKLLASVLSRAEDGSYWLRTPAEYGQIRVESAPMRGVLAEIQGEGRSRQIRITTNLGDVVSIGREHPLFLWPAGPGDEGEPVPHVTLWRGLSARLDRAVFHQLAELAEPAPPELGGDRTLCIWAAGRTWPIGPAE